MGAPFSLPSDLARAPWQIADPGHLGVINITQSGVMSIVTAGTETNNLNAPFKEGIRIVFEHMTDGGSRAITSLAGAINKAGNTIMTFADVRDACELVSVKTATGFRWAMTWNDDVALS